LEEQSREDQAGQGALVMKKFSLLIAACAAFGCSPEWQETAFALEEIPTVALAPRAKPFPLTQAVVVGEEELKLFVPSCHLKPIQVGIVFIEGYERSTRIAHAYREAYDIPEENMVGVDLPIFDVASEKDFGHAFERVKYRMPPHVQVLALAWTNPHRVGDCRDPNTCMSMTSAFALGLDLERWAAYSAAWDGIHDLDQMHANREQRIVERIRDENFSPYFNSQYCLPFTELGIRPAMMLPGTPEQADVLIARGKRSQLSFPRGKAFLVRTNDRNERGEESARNTRSEQVLFSANQYIAVETHFPNHDLLDVVSYNNALGDPADNEIRAARNVLFYFTGQATMEHIHTNKFLPGAYGEHLTSFAGNLRTPDSLRDAGRYLLGRGIGRQTTVMAWLNLDSPENGVTGSAGAVVEPIGIWSKFPHIEVLIREYIRGSQLVVALAKSVAFPGHTLFVGDPLARPWGTRAEVIGKQLKIKTTELSAYDAWVVQKSYGAHGPWTTVKEIPVRTEHAPPAVGEAWREFEFVIDDIDVVAHYRIVLAKDAERNYFE
jgi:uncharacterized protein (TIGR03790 family)